MDALVPVPRQCRVILGFLGPRGALGPNLGGDQERDGQRPGSHRESEERERPKIQPEKDRSRAESLTRAFADAEKGRGAQGSPGQQEDKETRVPERLALGLAEQERPQDPETAGGSARGRGGERAGPDGGGRRADAVVLLIIRGFPLSESAFGDTGTKAVHHITARPGGSLRSRRLIRGERVGPAGRGEADP